MQRATFVRRTLCALGGLTLVPLVAGGGTPGTTALAAGSTGAARAVPGWPGGLAAYEGRYRLTKSSQASFAASGMLTIFGRTVPRVAKPQMSGILALYTTGDTNVVYLTHFVHAGTKLSAQVNLGIYTGPEIGNLRVLSHQGTSLSVSYVPLQGVPVTLRFRRISADPHP